MCPGVYEKNAHLLKRNAFGQASVLFLGCERLGAAEETSEAVDERPEGRMRNLLSEDSRRGDVSEALALESVEVLGTSCPD